MLYEVLVLIAVGYGAVRVQDTLGVRDKLTDDRFGDCLVFNAMGKVKATALVCDVRVVLPGTSEKSDAIAVALDHKDKYSVVVMFPYVLHAGKLTIGTPFAQKGEVHCAKHNEAWRKVAVSRRVGS
jgi:hypothetical protein